MRSSRKRTSERLAEKIKVAKEKVIEDLEMAGIEEEIEVTDNGEGEKRLRSELKEAQKREDKYLREIQVLTDRLAQIAHIENERERVSLEVSNLNEIERDKSAVVESLEVRIDERQKCLDVLDEEIEVK